VAISATAIAAAPGRRPNRESPLMARPMPMPIAPPAERGAGGRPQVVAADHPAHVPAQVDAAREDHRPPVGRPTRERSPATPSPGNARAARRPPATGPRGGVAVDEQRQERRHRVRRVVRRVPEQLAHPGPERHRLDAEPVRPQPPG
jgi:hypothetical protein